MNSGSSRGDYYREKNEKLLQQNNRVTNSSLFKGLRIYINGYTIPTRAELRDLLLLHGGIFETYQTSRVTHIIASNLPNTKVRQYHEKKQPTPVVRPEWITDSIAASKLLPFQRYLLDSISSHKMKQPTAKDGRAFVKSFFEKSRLHHIGSWRTQFQETVRKHQLLIGKPPKRSDRVILHVDMDCFFVSVAIRHQRELRDKPIGIAHSNNERGYSEISSCNYVARSFGLKAGMFMKKGKELCPELLVLPYDFEAIGKTSERIYSIFFKYAELVEAVSCDEAFIQIPPNFDPMETAQKIRDQIFEETKCPASVGISGNKLMARMATKKAKPNGQFYIPLKDAAEHLRNIPVRGLHGVGRKTCRKLEELGVFTCGELAGFNQETLRRVFGSNNGRTLHEHSMGIDRRELETEIERKSISAEISYGVRFDVDTDTHGFIIALTEELCSRMKNANVQGCHFSLKILRPKPGTGESKKYLGCGWCDSFTKSTQLGSPTADVDILSREYLKLLHQINIPCTEIRGVGMHASKLYPIDHPGGRENSAILQGWLNKSSPEEETKQSVEASPSMTTRTASCSPEVEFIKTRKANEVYRSQIDPQVFNELPRDVQAEILQEFKTPVRLKRKQPESTELRESQIDPAVFNSLPASVRKDIQRALGLKRKVSTARSKPVVARSPIVVQRSEPFKIQTSQGLREYMVSRPDPDESDAAKITNVLRERLCNYQLDIVECCLRVFRRQSIRLSSWKPVFNSVLDLIQIDLQTHYRAVSFCRIEPFNLI